MAIFHCGDGNMLSKFDGVQNGRAAEPIARRSYTVREVEDITGLSHTTVHGLLKSGALESVRVGRRRLILADSIERLLRVGAR